MSQEQLQLALSPARPRRWALAMLATAALLGGFVGYTHEVYADCDALCCSPQATCWKNCSCKQPTNGACPIPPATIERATKRFFDYWIAWDMCWWCFSDPVNSRDAWKNVRQPPGGWDNLHDAAEAKWNAIDSNLILYDVGGVGKANIGSTMWDWCTMAKRLIDPNIKGFTEWHKTVECPCGIPSTWMCYMSARIRISGWVFWQEPTNCDASLYVRQPNEVPVPATCTSEGTTFKEPSYTTKRGGKRTVMHEFGHAIGLLHPSEPVPHVCVAENGTIMDGSATNCTGIDCNSIQPTPQDGFALFFLYGP